MLNRLAFVFSEAFIAIRRNLAMSFAAITTGAVSLFLLGVMGFGYKLADDYVKNVPAMFDMRVFLREGATPNQVHETAEDIRKIRGVKLVSWVPSAKAWALEKKQHPELTAGIDNPLPEQFKVVLADIKHGDEIAEEIQSFPTVATDNGVQYLREEQKMAVAAIETFRLLGPGLVGLLLAATAILIYNTIRLAVIARRLEIRVMQLVGASRFVVRFPFIVEGIVQGLLAGAVAGGLMAATNRIVVGQMTQQNLQFAAFPTTDAVWLALALGSGYGLLCSLIAVRVPIRYR